MSKKSAVLVLFVGDKLLLTRRSRNLRAFPSQWCFVGGKVDEGETSKEACVRECLEEMGILVDISAVKELSGCPKYFLGEYEVDIFTSRVDSLGKVVQNTSEVEEWGLFTPDTLPELQNMTKDIVEILGDNYATKTD